MTSAPDMPNANSFDETHLWLLDTLEALTRDDQVAQQIRYELERQGKSLHDVLQAWPARPDERSPEQERHVQTAINLNNALARLADLKSVTDHAEASAARYDEYLNCLTVARRQGSEDAKIVVVLFDTNNAPPAAGITAQIAQHSDRAKAAQANIPSNVAVVSIGTSELHDGATIIRQGLEMAAELTPGATKVPVFAADPFVVHSTSDWGSRGATVGIADALTSGGVELDQLGGIVLERNPALDDEPSIPDSTLLRPAHQTRDSQISLPEDLPILSSRTLGAQDEDWINNPACWHTLITRVEQLEKTRATERDFLDLHRENRARLDAESRGWRGRLPVNWRRANVATIDGDHLVAVDINAGVLSFAVARYHGDIHADSVYVTPHGPGDPIDPNHAGVVLIEGTIHSKLLDEVTTQLRKIKPDAKITLAEAFTPTDHTATKLSKQRRT